MLFLIFIVLMIVLFSISLTKEELEVDETEIDINRYKDFIYFTLSLSKKPLTLREIHNIFPELEIQILHSILTHMQVKAPLKKDEKTISRIQKDGKNYYFVKKPIDKSTKM